MFELDAIGYDQPPTSDNPLDLPTASALPSNVMVTHSPLPSRQRPSNQKLPNPSVSQDFGQFANVFASGLDPRPPPPAAAAATTSLSVPDAVPGSSARLQHVNEQWGVQQSAAHDSSPAPPPRNVVLPPPPLSPPPEASLNQSSVMMVPANHNCVTHFYS